MADPGSFLDPSSWPLWMQSGQQPTPPPAPYQQGDLAANMPPVQPTGILDALKGMFSREPWSAGGAISAATMGLGRMPGSATASNPVIPMKSYKPNTYFPGEPPSAANMNPPKTLNWQGPNESGLNVGGEGYFNRPQLPADPIRGEPGASFASTDRGHNLAVVTDKWNWDNGQDSHFTYQPRIHKPVPNGTTEAHQGPEFRSREVAQQYTDALLKSGKFGPTPDPSFAAPFLARDAQALRQLLANKARGGFGVVK